MNAKVIFLFWFLAITGRAYTQEPSMDVISASDIIQVVQKANLTLNMVYKGQESGTNAMQKRIIKEIYSTNDILFSIRDLVFDQSNHQVETLKIVSSEVHALSISLSSLNDTLSSPSLLNAILDIKSKAKQIRGKFKRLKD